ncbi:MAG: hypothetical protein SVS85_00165, partial [Candidatus Nanohaloarchaea archaeon]|nr:hypothetical protein [Candidatus Nanohaloarchaea archaeon]
MKSRHALMALAALVLVAGMAAPVAAQNTTVENMDDVEEPEEDENETDDSDDVNETEEENETMEREMERDREREHAPGKSAEFDARLMTAINTVDALTEIAPSNETEQRLEKALAILKGVQEDTDTAS